MLCFWVLLGALLFGGFLGPFGVTRVLSCVHWALFVEGRTCRPPTLDAAKKASGVTGPRQLPTLGPHVPSIAMLSELYLK